MRALSAAASGLAIALGCVVLTPQVSSAASARPASGYGCSGTVVDTIRVSRTAGGPLYGYGYLYYSSENGGTNCAVYVTAMDVGVKRWMGVDIQKTGLAPVVTDNGYYGTYAGPVAVTGTNGHCITATFWDEPPSGSGPTTDALVGVACG